jgi:hypothetical protein
MGRVWYLECQARARMGDADGLLASIRKVCAEGEKRGYFWRERYGPKGGYGVEKYCEYPANLIRIVQRFLLGVEHRLDGSLVLAPTVPEAFWAAGFGQTLTFRGRTLTYRMQRDGITGEYRGDGPQRVLVRFRAKAPQAPAQAEINGRPAVAAIEGEFATITLPAALAGQPCRFTLSRVATP